MRREEKTTDEKRREEKKRRVRIREKKTRKDNEGYRAKLSIPCHVIKENIFWLVTEL